MMKHQKRISAQLFVAVIACLVPTPAWNQCSNHVTHFSGTQQMGCHTVTVTSDGPTGWSNICGYGPHRMGTSSNGNFTFTFTPSVEAVSINVSAINNQSNGTEEISIEINGLFYPITVPGSPDGCSSPAIITPTGTIGAMSGQIASWKDIYINTPISSIKVENVIISGQPLGSVFSLYFCSACCETDAGTLVASPLQLCPDDIATVPDATQTFLESNDILRYMLFSDPGDTLGSILATSITPSFAFNPATMQTGVTYYIAAIAGNNLNGNVDLTACLDISNAIEVIWHPKPAVSFAVADPNVCAGACTTVTAIFTGTTPFTLTYTTPLSGLATQTFSGNTGTFQVCTPVGSAPGSLVVQATTIMDAWCICN